VADWVTISSLATAAGTLVLAGATFSAVRSANRSARIAEQALQEQRRPVLVDAKAGSPPQKIMFADGHWLRAEAGQAAVVLDEGSVYLGLTLRNLGAGIAVLQGWYPWPDRMLRSVPHAPLEEFHRQIRDIYIAPGDIGMWQGALRPQDGEIVERMRAVCEARRPFTIDLLYSDQVGGQRTVTRFGVTPAGEDRWLNSVGIHWNLDAAGPRGDD
jgi:hypothetical protein